MLSSIALSKSKQKRRKDFERAMELNMHFYDPNGRGLEPLLLIFLEITTAFWSLPDVSYSGEYWTNESFSACQKMLPLNA